MKKVVVTGGAGFIGANFIKMLLDKHKDIKLYNFDKITYAGDLTRLEEIQSDSRYEVVKDDICNEKAVGNLLSDGIDTIVHFAAETHVDRSLINAEPFIDTNVKGTYSLLKASLKSRVKRIIHISTDEVYGEINKGSFTEESGLNPKNPYSASKASADLMVLAFVQTYNLPVIILRPSNNYGPWQYPDKFIPLVISKAVQDEKIPVYSKGENIREWIYVDDCIRGIINAAITGRTGQIYNLGSGFESTNINLVKKILKLLGKPQSLIEFVKDRPGHDLRYSMDSDKLNKETGWNTATDFETGLEKTVEWYLKNKKWWSSFSNQNFIRD